MKKKHTLLVVALAFALALAPGFAQAGFVIIFDDPDTPEIDFRIEDEGEGDTKDGVTGLLGVAIDYNGLEVIASASSNPDDKGSPNLLMSINALRYAGNQLKISLTDTDFAVSTQIQVTATVAVNFIGGAQSLEFDFWGDPGNMEFGEVSNIVSIGPLVPPPASLNQSQIGDAGPVGSLTLSTLMESGSGTEFEINTAFSLGLKAGVPEPPASVVNCPPSIIGVTVAGVENVSDGCTIFDAIIENGDIKVTQVANFYIQETEVRDGDIEVDAVASNTQITRNRVLNGDIKVTGSQNVGVYLNIVNGQLDVKGNDGATVDGNIVNGNIEVDENSGLDITRVLQNIATGNGSITVEDNEVVEVTDNRASRDLKCKDNQEVIASGNNAQRKLECESGSQD